MRELVGEDVHQKLHPESVVGLPQEQPEGAEEADGAEGAEQFTRNLIVNLSMEFYR